MLTAARTIVVAGAFGVWGMASAHSSAQTASSATDLAQALQRKYDTVRDFSADFVHTYRGGVLRRQLSERGRVSIKKPGRMRWEYTAPDEKLFVSDGVNIYSYVPEDKQVMVIAVPDESAATTPALFLAGRGSIDRDFTAELVPLPEGLPKELTALKLTPRSRQPDFEWLTVGVDPKTLALRGLVFVDAQGGTSTFSFADLKENIGLADKTFDFRIPRGVNVVTDASPR
jgi:outer membrane lipoprotein carrier protein